MNTMKKFILMISLLFLLLIFHNETIIGTQNGLLLWYQTLIPSLLPFILITNALSETNAYQAATIHFRKHPSNRIYEIMAILLGNLCGYPIGGKLINDFVRNHYFTPERANKLLSLSSQASPMFLIGYVHLHILKNIIPLPVFLISIYLPVLIFCPLLLRKNETIPYASPSSQYKNPCICDTFIHAVQIMVMIGMYVIIFSILLEIILPFCGPTPSKVILSFLEITTGLKLLNSLSLPFHIKTAFLCAVSSFGGLCSAFQIKGVLNYPKADIKKYLLDKLLLSTGTFLIILFYLKLFLH